MAKQMEGYWAGAGAETSILTNRTHVKMELLHNNA